MNRLTTLVLGLIAIAAVGAFALAALSAHAEGAPVITQTLQNSSNASITSATIGTSVHDVVGIASSTSSTLPTGMVDFNVYSNTTCAGSATTQAAVALVNGFATSSNTVLGASGLSYTVRYSGDASNTPATSGCIVVTPTSQSVHITNQLSTTTNVFAGTIVTDSAALTGTTANATGSVAYNVYSNNTCTTFSVAAGQKTVANASVPASNQVQFNFAGTYYWQAVYSGDQNDAAATSSCTALTVVATSTPTIPATIGTISGKVFSDTNNNDVLDAGEQGIAGVTVWLHSGSNYNDPIAQTAITDANGNYSFENLAMGAYFVEEKEPAGYTQNTDDSKITLSTTTSSATLNFANASSTSTGTHGDHGKGNGDDDNGHDHDTNGKHKGWFIGNGHAWGRIMHDMQFNFKDKAGNDSDNDTDD